MLFKNFDLKIEKREKPKSVTSSHNLLSVGIYITIMSGFKTILFLKKTFES